MADISGFCDSRFESLIDVLSAQIDEGEDLGSSVAVTLEGEMVVDIWGGWCDSERQHPWQHDTITNVWSTTKTMASLCALVLVERGLLDVYAPVSQYWPEFAANGKEQIVVRQVMAHTSGLSGWDQPIAIEDLYNWDVATQKLAAQAPWWEPGTASGYHALTQGYLIGEIVRRVSGRSLGQFFAQEIAGPLGADFHIGLDPSQYWRVANVIPPPAVERDHVEAASMAVRTMTSPLITADVAWGDEWRAAEIPAANGHGNARSVALIQAIVANGGTVGGVSLLSPDTINLIFDEQANGVDLVLGEQTRFGIGYGLIDETVEFLSGGRMDGRICYWGGWGGSVIVVDVDRRLTFAYMMNQMAGQVTGNTTADALATVALSASV